MRDHRKLYKAINRSFERRYLHRPGRRGFTAEFIHVLKCAAYCLENKVQFCLQQEPKALGSAVDKGWENHFEPMYANVLSRCAFLNRSHFPVDRLPVLRAISRGILKTATGCDLFLFDAPIVHRPPARMNVPTLGFGTEYWQDMSSLARILWHYNAETRDAVHAIKAQLPLPERYLAIHIRRGDKKTETSYIPVDWYVQQIKIKVLEYGIRDIFVATDDSRVIEEVRQALDQEYRLHSAPSLQRGGYDQRTFNKQSLQNRKRAMWQLFAELEAMWQADVFFGTSTSNVFNIAQYMRANKNVVDVGEAHGASRAVG